MPADDLQPPLTSAVFFILFALSDGEKHGYAIMQDVSKLSSNKFRMGPGTLYTTIQRLLDLKLIAETRDSIAEEGRRRYYKLTRAGKSLFEAELSRLDALLRLAHRKKLASEGAQ
jgi:DNA-binding PadR family transcriptional regulator